MKKLAALALSLFLTTGIALADTPKDAEPAKPAVPAKPKAAKKAEKSDSAIAAEIEELRQALESQQEQLQLLKEELAKRDRQIDEAREAAAAANARASEASTKAVEAANSSAEVKTSAETLNTTVNTLKASTEALKTTVATVANNEAAQEKSSEEGPSTLKFKGVNITPGGFIEAATVFRNRATSADINTPFTGIPYTANNLAHVTESNFTARQSRATVLAESKIGSTKLTGYFEMDFLGAGTTSNNRESNSYLLRQRQIWAQAALDNGLSITGGQMWTLATENRKGIQNRGEDLPMMIDPQYVVGFTWDRQYALRVVKDFGGKFALGVSAEGPQALIGGRGFSSVTTINSAAAASTIPTTGATSTINGNFFINAPGSGGGLYNTFDNAGSNSYTVNKAPDFIIKAAIDPGFGHYEVFGIISLFRDRIYPCGVVGTNTTDTVKGTTTVTGNCTSATPTVVSSFGATNMSTTGGGGGASALFSAFNKHVDFGVKAVAGDGIGRYGSAQLADATARPDGTLSLIRTLHGLGRVELHPSPKLDIYAYYGAEYAWRSGYSGYTAITITKTTAIPATATTPAIPATTTTKISTTGIGGYGNVAANNTGCSIEGVPVNQFNTSSGSNCAGDIRIIQEGTLGFWHKIYQGPKGGMRWGIQYSYIFKNAWSGTGGVPAGALAIGPKANNNMVFTSFRYYLP